MRGRVLSWVAAAKRSSGPVEAQGYGVSLLLANTMSIAPKIDEVRSVILDWSPASFFYGHLETELRALTAVLDHTL